MGPARFRRFGGLTCRSEALRPLVGPTSAAKAYWNATEKPSVKLDVADPPTTSRYHVVKFQV